jgi:hypothetical protein
MSIRHWFGLLLLVALSFFILAGTGMFTFWFWLQIFD